MKFQKTYCSQCGGEFGPGDAGFSSCAEHTKGNKDLMFAQWYDSLEGTKTQGFAYKAWCAALYCVKCAETFTEQEPFGYVYQLNRTHIEFSKVMPPDDAYDEGHLTPVFTAPPSKPWVDLTNDEAAECWSTSAIMTWKRIQDKLREKNA